MKLGIDFGTTRIVAAAVDRGNYPVVRFESSDDTLRDWYPPLIAVRGEQRLYGWEAFAVQSEREWTVIRSIKKLLSDSGPHTRIEVGGQAWPLHQLLEELTANLKESLLSRSTAPGSPGEPLEIYLGVPANANSNQRFLTSEAFRASGFDVLGLLNEPSAASIEFSHRHRDSLGSKDTTSLLVYDLGGGTFDVSLVSLQGHTHTVLGSEGISTLGGDDFDDILAEIALETAGIDQQARDSMTQAELFRLEQECRQRKEAINPNSRKVVVELEGVRGWWGEVAVPVKDYYARCEALVEETMLAVDHLLARHGFVESADEQDGRRLDAVYVAGGGSELPLVPRGLRERFGRRVRRSAHGHLTTAIGLAIQADETAGYVLRDRFTRYFGVWREWDDGRGIAFDPLFTKETPLPGPREAPLVINRHYVPVHDVGHFRYLECSHLSELGQPTGDITLWDEIRFPFDPALRERNDLRDISVNRSLHAAGQQIEEAYTCDGGGSLAVAITNHSGGYTRQFQLGRWGLSEQTIQPSQQSARRKKRAKTR
jgi:molecular chaperone DnaK (HSP70)